MNSDTEPPTVGVTFIHSMSFTFDIGEQAFICGVPIADSDSVLNQIVYSALNHVTSAVYDGNNHKIIITLDVLTTGHTVTLLNTITDQEGNNIIATTAIVNDDFSWKKQ